VIATVLGFYCINVILFAGTVILRLDALVSLSFCVVTLGWLAYKTRKKQPLHRLKLEPVGALASSSQSFLRLCGRGRTWPAWC